MRVSIFFYHERSESNMPSLVAQGKVASTKPPIEAAASRMSGVRLQLYGWNLQVCRRASRADGRSDERSARARVNVENSGLRCMFHSTHPPRQPLTLRAEAPSLWQKGRAYTCTAHSRGTSSLSFPKRRTAENAALEEQLARERTSVAEQAVARG